MSMQTTIEQKLTDAFSPITLNIENESHMHGGSATESHFKVTLVSEKFSGKMLIARHRMINETLKEELDGQIHALTLHTMTTEEYAAKGGVVADSPPCQGGDQ